MQANVKRRTVAELLAAQKEREAAASARRHGDHELLIDAIGQLDERTAVLEDIREDVRFLVRGAKFAAVAGPVAFAVGKYFGLL